MTVNYEYESNESLGFDTEAIALQVIGQALEQMKCPFEAEVNLLITGSDEIHEMNREYRGIDRPTDVLSFPMQEYDVPGDFRFLDNPAAAPDSFHPETGELLLGDIVINTQRVLSQAEEFGHSVTREYAFLIAHSMLHLMGFDHETPDEAAEMEALQEQILETLGITRD